VLAKIFKKRDLKIESLLDGIRDADLKLVDQAKINNLYKRTASQENFICDLED